jgi:hypothetical protein
MMFLLAVTALDKIQAIPTAFWINLGVAVLLLILLVVVLRKLAEVNKVVLAIAGTVAITGLAFSWIYERDEPKFMTPYVEKIAPFFPSKTNYTTKQQSAPKP